jgi:hypothetical protein
VTDLKTYTDDQLAQLQLSLQTSIDVYNDRTKDAHKIERLKKIGFKPSINPATVELLNSIKLEIEERSKNER